MGIVNRAGRDMVEGRELCSEGRELSVGPPGVRSKVDHFCWIFFVLATVSQIISEGLAFYFFQNRFLNFFSLRKMRACWLSSADALSLLTHLFPGLHGFWYTGSYGLVTSQF